MAASKVLVSDLLQRRLHGLIDFLGKVAISDHVPVVANCDNLTSGSQDFVDKLGDVIFGHFGSLTSPDLRSV